MLDVSSEEITTGRLLRSLVVLSIPLFFQQLVLTAGQIVDLFWLGRFDESAVSAIGLALPAVNFVITLVLFAPYTGTQVLVSQRVGNEDLAGARRAGFHGLVIAGAFGVAGGLLLFFFAEPLVRAVVGIQPNVESSSFVRLTVVYLQIVGIGVSVTTIGDVLAGIYLGWGNSKVTLYTSVASVVLNATSTPFLVFGWASFPSLGIRGAALGTVLGYVAALAAVLLMAVRDEAKIISMADAEIVRDDFVEILNIGVPPSIQNAGRELANIALVTVVFAIGGGVGLAVYLVGVRVAAIAAIPSSSLQQAAQNVIGQNLGADKVRRANRATWVGIAISGGVLAIIGIIQFAFAGTLVQVIAPELEGRSATLAVEFVQIIALGYPAIGAISLFQSGFDGAGHTQVTMVASLVQYWVLQFGILLVGGIVLDFGLQAVFWSIPLANIIAALALGGYYHVTVRNGRLQRAAKQIT